MQDPFGVIDWGSSNFRACLVTGDGEVVGRIVTREGVANLTRQQMADAVEGVAERWPAHARDILCCGMIGSTVGWVEVPYLECPIAPGDIAHRMSTVKVRSRTLRIAPGLVCRTEAGLPDVIRGEEVLCLGAVRQLRHLREGSGLVCMPGTHTKWIAIEKGRIHRFTTSLVGELFGALSTSGILRNHLVGDVEVSDEFRRGVRLGRSGRGLARQLFSVRSRSVVDGLPARESPSYASGILIGHDVEDAMQTFAGGHGTRPIALVGDSRLCELYAAALEEFDREIVMLEAESACVQGFLAIRSAGRELEP